MRAKVVAILHVALQHMTDCEADHEFKHWPRNVGLAPPTRQIEDVLPHGFELAHQCPMFGCVLQNIWVSASDEIVFFMSEMPH